MPAIVTFVIYALKPTTIGMACPIPQSSYFRRVGYDHDVDLHGTVAVRSDEGPLNCYKTARAVRPAFYRNVGAMICEDCTKGFQLDGAPQGTLHGAAYLAAAPPGAAPTRAVVLFTDIFGLALPNPKLLADELARTLRVDVWVPDLFGGRPPVTLAELAPHSSPLPGARKTCWEQVKWYAFLAQKAGALRQVRAAVVDPAAIQFLEKIRAERGYETIGAVGYCFGGSLALRLASTDLIQGAVIAHPGGAPLDVVRAIKIPTVWLCAEDDAQFPAAARDAAERALAARAEPLPHEFVVYPGTTHGFAARPALQYPQIKDAFEKAFAKTVAFLDGLLNGAAP